MCNAYSHTTPWGEQEVERKKNLKCFGPKRSDRNVSVMDGTKKVSHFLDTIFVQNSVNLPSLI